MYYSLYKKISPHRLVCIKTAPERWEALLAVLIKQEILKDTVDNIQLYDDF